MSVDSDQCSGRPQRARNSAVVERVENLTMEDRCLTVRQAVKDVEISTGSENAILCDHVLSSCEIYSHDYAGGTKVTPSCKCVQNLLEETIHNELGPLQHLAILLCDFFLLLDFI
ncbi:hypothetical protein TNCV_4926561 [Trichonephila clavipes]|nr:hypothetical protein TNCV_4926561 [Trichonephila clavipes]